MEKQKQFITNASHELKTPLAVIKANTELQEIMDGETEWTQSTLRQVDRMNGLIANLLQIARAQEKSDGELSQVDIAATISETADTFIPVAESEGKRLEKKIPDSLVIRSNDSSIRQLTTLLIDNAIKYTNAPGDIKVEVKSDSDWVIFSVADTGIGIAVSEQKNIFNDFYRVGDEMTRSTKGSGLGLATVKRVAETHKATISLVSKPGKGSTFIVKFKKAE